MFMKRLLCFLGAALLLLAGCSSGKGEATEYVPADTAQALLDSGAFDQQLAALDPDMAAAYLGLAADPEEAAVYTSLEGGYEELAVLKLSDGDAAKAALDALTAHVAAQAATEADVQYKPEDLPKLEKAMVRKVGNTVLLVVAADYEKVEAALQ